MGYLPILQRISIVSHCRIPYDMVPSQRQSQGHPHHHSRTPQQIGKRYMTRWQSELSQWQMVDGRYDDEHSRDIGWLGRRRYGNQGVGEAGRPRRAAT